VGERPVAETAAVIASGTGVLGTNRQYLEQLATQLQRLGIEDEYIRDLVPRVRRIPPP
jgi:cation transport protein ChaC